MYVQSAFKVLTFCVQSYLIAGEIAVPHDNLSLGIPGAISVRKCPESSELATSKSPAHYEKDEEFDLRDVNQSFEDLSIENEKDITFSIGQASTSASLVNNSFRQESIVNLLNLVEFALGPLSTNHDVEI